MWADRHDRKRVLITSDVVRLVVQLTAGLLLVTGRAEVVQLAVLAAAYGAADAFFAPAFTGLLPSTVTPVNLQPANALRGLTYSVGAIAGPLLAGLLIAFAGGPGRRAAVRRRDVPGQRRAADAAAAADGRRGARRRGPAGHRPLLGQPAGRAGPRSAAARG